MSMRFVHESLPQRVCFAEALGAKRAIGGLEEPRRELPTASVAGLRFR